MKRTIPMTPMRRVFWLAICFLPLACGVKEKTPGSNQFPVVTSGELPAGIVVTKGKKFLVRSSASEISSGQVTILYKVVTDGMDLLSASEYTIDVQYLMPEMPEMAVTPAKIELPTPGQVKVTYDISMGGRWDITLKFLKGGTVVDTILFSYDAKDT